jgi:hypothetical protein
MNLTLLQTIQTLQMMLIKKILKNIQKIKFIKKQYKSNIPRPSIKANQK